MRAIRRFAIFATLVSCTAGGSSAGTGHLAKAPTGEPICRVDRSSYCQDRPCPTYDAAAATVRQRVRAECQGGTGSCPYSEAVIGVCGQARFVSVSEGSLLTTQYFDEGGRLVATFESQRSSRFCGGGGVALLMGEVANCAQVNVEELVKRR
jgi:hypothetical protein